MTSPSQRRPPHKTAHPVCDNGAKTWGECDKVREDRYADWQAFQEVLLAYRIAVRPGRPEGYKDKDLFSQLVQLIRGEREELINGEGNPAITPWAMRIRGALDRFKAGDFPVYCLYRIPGIEPGPDTYWTPTTGPYARRG